MRFKGAIGSLDDVDKFSVIELWNRSSKVVFVDDVTVVSDADNICICTTPSKFLDEGMNGLIQAVEDRDFNKDSDVRLRSAEVDSIADHGYITTLYGIEQDPSYMTWTRFRSSNERKSFPLKIPYNHTLLIHPATQGKSIYSCVIFWREL